MDTSLYFILGHSELKQQSSLDYFVKIVEAEEIGRGNELQKFAKIVVAEEMK